MFLRGTRRCRSYWSQFPEKEQILREKVDWNVSERPFFSPSYITLAPVY